MFDSQDLGQAALESLIAAAERVRFGGTEIVDVRLRAAYLNCAPAGHPAAASPLLDLSFLAAAHGLGGDALFAAERVIACPRRARSRPVVNEAPGVVELHLNAGDEGGPDALALVLGISVEADKARRALGNRGPGELGLLERLLGVPATDLVAAFGDAESALSAIDALCRGGPDRVLHVEPVPHVPLAGADGGKGPVWIFVGAVERAHDLVSPFVRRLSGPLARLAGRAASDSNDDTLYAAVDEVFTSDPGCFEERLETERAAGLLPMGASLLVDFHHVDPRAADRRVHDAVATLRKNRGQALLVGSSRQALRAAIERFGDRVTTVVTLAEGLVPPGEVTLPDVLARPDQAALVGLDNMLLDARLIGSQKRIAVSVPSLGLAPSSLLDKTAVQTRAYEVQQELLRGRAEGLLPRNLRTACAVYSPADLSAPSAVMVSCLTRMAEES